MHLAVFPLARVGLTIELLEFAETSDLVILKVTRIDTSVGKSEAADAVFPAIFEKPLIF